MRSATLIDALFETHGWARSWRDTIYDFVHYHSQIHEVMGVARGTAKIECGGLKGRVLSLKAGAVLVLPAGTGHRLIEASRNFLVVGAYPRDGTYDECTDTREMLIPVELWRMQLKLWHAQQYPSSLFGNAASGLEPRILRACRQFSGWKPSASDRELQYVP